MPACPPSWQREPCPRWCIREHDEDDIPLDRYHQGTPATVPVLISAHPEDPRSADFEPADLTIRVGRHAGESVGWIAIEPISPATPRVVLTAESAGRLAQEISDQLAKHGNRDQV